MLAKAPRSIGASRCRPGRSRSVVHRPMYLVPVRVGVKVRRRMITAHGGLDRWNAVRSVDVTFNFSGGLLDLRGRFDGLPAVAARTRARRHAACGPDQQNQFAEQ